VVVAAVLAAGSEKAAAHRLGLSHSTVKHHLANARSKVRLTPAAYRHGLALALPDADWRARQVLDAR
jgi:DNA-binding NarL/FixJ family response regulator